MLWGLALGLSLVPVASVSLAAADVLWARAMGGTSYDTGYGISTLSDGSSIATGRFTDSADFGNGNLTSAGGYDVFVAKRDAAGSIVWVTTAGGTSSDEGMAISTLSDGSAIVTGKFWGASATFGNTTLTSAGNYDVFVAKLDAGGNWLWATRGGGTSGDEGMAISALSDGSAIVSGYFQGTATFGSTTLTSAGAQDVFVAKIDASGNWLWALQSGGISYDFGHAIGTLSDGSSIQTGRFTDSADFGGGPLTSAGGSDVFVAKRDADGSFLWVRIAGGTSNDGSYAISTLSDGSAIVAGYFIDTATFGSTTLTSAGSVDLFVAKIDALGNWLWATSAGGSSSQDSAKGVSTLSDGSAIVTGGFGDAATFGSSTTLTSIGSYDAFVAKIDALGNWLWATSAGGTSGERGEAVSTLSDGSPIVTGFFYETARFGATTLVSTGQSDVFVAKFSSPPDSDNDGVSNADEVAAGTDPIDSDSIPVTEPPMPVTTLPTFAMLLLSLLLGLFGYRRLAH